MRYVNGRSTTAADEAGRRQAIAHELVFAVPCFKKHPLLFAIVAFAHNWPALLSAAPWTTYELVILRIAATIAGATIDGQTLQWTMADLWALDPKDLAVVKTAILRPEGKW
jgi:hypothetical protein